MKKILTTLIVIATINCFGQSNQISKIGLYKWTQVVFLQPCDINGNNLPVTTATGGAATTAAATTSTTTNEITSKYVGQQFRVLKLTPDGASAIIQILGYTQSKATTATDRKALEPAPGFYDFNFKGTPTEYDALIAEDVNSRSYGSHQAYFKVGVNVIDECALKQAKTKWSLAAGVITFPFKFRPQKGMQDFSGAFNFGAGLGVTIPRMVWREATFSIITGYSISSVMLDSSNTQKHQDKLTSTNNFSAFSFSVGPLVQYQRVQAGVFIGWDRINNINQREYAWQYQGKPWISVCFGIAIFSGAKEDERKTQGGADGGQ